MKKALIISTVLLLVLTLLPMIDLQVGWIRIWGYPRLQIAVLMYLTLIGWAFQHKHVKKNLVLIILLIVAAVYQSIKFVPYTFFWKKQVVDTEKQDKQQEINFLFYNVLQFNKNTDAFLEQARLYHPDIILLAETDEFWRSKMEPLQKEYEYKVLVPQSNTYGLCLYSKFPLTSTKVRFIVEPDIPSIETLVTLKSGKKIKLYCIHPEPPNLKKSTTDRDAELVIVAKEIAKTEEPVIVAGDLNDVAWSSTTRLFTDLSRCNDPRVGRGLYNTFNAKYFFMRWPLDHYFVSRDFTLNRIDRLPKLGSDHFPIYISFTYNPEAKEKNKLHKPDEGDMKEADKKLREEKKEETN
jgi:endonuclease/exonuclease/phosphatase (EEP) superfamily protein YafD